MKRTVPSKHPVFLFRRLPAILVMALCSLGYARAQQPAQLSGKVVNSVTLEPIPGVTVYIVGQELSVTTDAKGIFYFSNVNPGEYTVGVVSPEIIQREFPVNIRANYVNDLPEIKVIYSGFNEASSMLGVVDESFIGDESDDKGQDINSTVILSNDPYISNMGFRMSPFRFRVRNYENRYSEKYINGVNVVDQYLGRFNYASIGAMNDLTRDGDVINYYNPGEFTYGNIGGAENINMRAGSYARGTRATATFTTGTYYARAMLNHSTGMMDNGWAATIGAGMRYSHEGFIPGTFYRNFSYTIGLEKEWRDGRHSLSFTTYGSPVERGQQGATYQEVLDLVGDNLYNPNWGYQDGKKRNARVVKAFDPTGILSHTWKINENSSLVTGVAVHYARYGSTALNWYKGSDPRPDYYRYLPSWYSGSQEAYDYYTKLWKSGYKNFTQINWEELYRANELNVSSGDGSSIYMVEERRSDLFETTLNSTLNLKLTDRSKVTGGVEYKFSKSLQFKTVNDLMGGLYITDNDKYAEQDYVGDSQTVQNDLNRPGRRVYEGDRFGYDYYIDMHTANAWVQNTFAVNNFDIYYGTKVSYTSFQRHGNMRNGRYPDSSYGKGQLHQFVDYGVKGGFTAKITGRHIVTGNVSYHTQSPIPYDAYLSPRITDRTVNLESEKIFAVDLNYTFSLPSFNGRVSVYQTNIYDGIDRWMYYFDNQRTFINHLLTGINKVSRGVEFGFKYRLDQNWSFDLAGTASEYYFSNNPTGTINYENGKISDEYEKVYLKDYYVGGAPQFAGTVSVNYFWNYWFFSAHLNGVMRNYIEIAPLRRLASNYLLSPEFAGVDPANDEDLAAFYALTDQEKFRDALTVDLSVGKILYLKNRNSLNFNLSVNNILNKKDIRTGGYEQGRFDLSYPDKFLSKYYYMQGTTCFLNVRYNF